MDQTCATCDRYPVIPGSSICEYCLHADMTVAHKQPATTDDLCALCRFRKCMVGASLCGKCIADFESGERPSVSHNAASVSPPPPDPLRRLEEWLSTKGNASAKLVIEDYQHFHVILSDERKECVGHGTYLAAAITAALDQAEREGL